MWFGMPYFLEVLKCCAFECLHKILELHIISKIH